MAKLSALILYSALLNGCGFNRPSATDYQRTPSHAIDVTQSSALKNAIEPAVTHHKGQSGFRIIARGQDALLMRLALIEAAEHSVDIQYYSMQNDKSGKLLLDAILRAADRGVRVRMLIDDLTINKRDKTWALIDTHRNISLRIFNPLATSDQGVLGPVAGLLTRLPQFSRRMHNKVFIVDNQISITGGRNLGDAYFDNSQDFNFRDIDILAAGPITAQMSLSFDSYWNGKEAFPIRTLNVSPCEGRTLKRFQALKEQCMEEVEKHEFPAPPPIVTELAQNEPPLIWAKAQLLADSPHKLEQPREQADSKPMSKLAELASHAQKEVIIVSPYFVPGDDGVEWLREIVARNVRVRVLTNSLSSTDVVAVHTGYRRYREAVLAVGIDLFEMKALPGKRVRTGRFASSSRASLHTKIYVIDRKELIIGTMNLDPRSVELNTEIALFIYDATLAENVAQMFEKAISPASSYHLIMGPEKSLEWVTEEKGTPVRYKGEPEAGFWRRLKAEVYGLLPFEDQL